MGNLTDAIRRMIDTLQISSASPGHINEVLQVDPSIDLDAALEEALKDTSVKTQKDTIETNKKVKRFDEGNVGDINRMTSQQFGNIQEFARNPFTFIMGSVLKKLTRGVGVIALVGIIFAAVKIIINELLKPGRFLDRRFKRDITKEIIQFRRREDQQKLRQGFSQIIITTMPRLRGGQGQTYNTFDHIRDRDLPPSIGQADILLASGVSFSKHRRRYSRNSVF